MKYKLIKEYPGSPKLSFVTSPKNDNAYYVNSNWIQPENYPEFWEQVVEKDYEILSLKYIKPNNWLWDYKTNQIIKCKITDNKVNFKRSNGSWDSYDSDYSGFVTEVFSIYSIRRLSDSEIFTIGDNTKYGCIDSFYIKNDHLLATTVLESNGRYLKELEKVKQPLFTTEDGVDIFEGDDYFKVLQETYLLLNMRNANVTHNTTATTFSTKEKAEEYILMNKPCLSINDVAKIFVSTNYTTKKGNLYPQGQRLRDLVKSKINNK